MSIALVHMGLGDKHVAFEWLEEANCERDANIL
jgi:hypothetical protein